MAKILLTTATAALALSMEITLTATIAAMLGLALFGWPH